jgi:hypothetical protein
MAKGLRKVTPNTESVAPPETEEKAHQRLPEDVAAIRAEIGRFFRTRGDDDRNIGSSKYGVYAFYDYDNEPIYVGQTVEKLSGRVSRHLTNQRTDAVAMNVLDPFEVAYIEVWPFDQVVEGMTGTQISLHLASAEYTVFEKLLTESKLGAVLNEKPVVSTATVPLPRSYKARIIPESIYHQRKHPDVRIARRASTIANLARVISERDVSPGLRITLLTQARRLESLATDRLEELKIPVSARKEL